MAASLGWPRRGGPRRWKQLLAPPAWRPLPSAPPRPHGGRCCGSERSRLGGWLDVQRQLVRDRAPAEITAQDRREAASEAFQQMIAGMDLDARGGSAVFVEPAQLQEILEDAAMCPAFSAELCMPGGPFERVLCSEEAFFGCVRRQQFFRNQLMRLFLEKFLIIRQSLSSLFEEDWAADADVVEGVFGDDLSLDGRDRLEAAFIFDSGEAPQAASFLSRDLFFVRGCVKPADAQGDAEGGQTPSSDWLLGTARRVVHTQDSRVSLILLRLHHIGPTQGFVPVSGEAAQLVHVGFIPSVFYRQLDAVRDLCEGHERFTGMVQGIFFPGGGPQGQRGAAAGAGEEEARQPAVRATAPRARPACRATSTSSSGRQRRRRSAALRSRWWRGRRARGRRRSRWRSWRRG
ncbi:unnamed protein product [Prorocentrum cordatum]|uniref:Uncharacterized protein n=1 Tax=Prorocentrum cordatum TaxID=2364126 RepID=A0ABN9SVJ3_9DINO|nr:unnamed protein product [Polarella glacialis]